MSEFNTQNSDTNSGEDFEKDDLITFQHDSKKISFYYSQLTKYSKHIRDSYLFSDAKNRFPQEIQQFQEEIQLLPESINIFFELLQQNYNINEDSILTYKQCVDLLKISKQLEIRKLSFKINQYIRSHKVDIDFVIQMIQYETKLQSRQDNDQFKISQEIENLLSSKINECFSNEKFKELPIQIIYRILKNSSPKLINHNKLFEIIKSFMSKFCILFQFLELQKLSEDRVEELCEMYSKSDENTKQYFGYLTCNLDFIKEMNKNKKNLQEANEEQLNKMKDLEAVFQKQFNDSEKVNAQIQSQLNNSEKVNAQLQSQLDESKKLINEQQNKMKEIEALLQKQFNEQLQNQIKYSKELENQVTQLQNKLTSSEKEITDINKQLIELTPIKGQVIASVKNGLLINAEINLKIKYSTLDTTKSKCIISTSDSKSLGVEAYEKGELITSLQMKTTFLMKSGTYYVRCIVFNKEGEFIELLSNSVTTNGSSAIFKYEGEPSKISLFQGQYKFEVWGAKGGDSTGKGRPGYNRASGPIVKGGLGGYSRGVLSLNEQKTVYIYVGGEGRPSDSSNGSCTKGGFPDGGGTKTGHDNSNYPTVPGTGGGSTSIRIGSESDYARVIVAGGGGGASGDSCSVSPGGFGGGLSGGNCFYQGSLKSQGGGTQTGSTRGLGECDGRHGDPGQFGSGATGKYCGGDDSGGGGGGGWYGGGSGGYGCFAYCSSGGGGSGWTFTESRFKNWESGDSSNASKFILNDKYYLTDETCLGGNEEFPTPEGNGNERGHEGNGYAKITPL